MIYVLEFGDFNAWQRTYVFVLKVLVFKENEKENWFNFIQIYIIKIIMW